MRRKFPPLTIRSIMLQIGGEMPREKKNEMRNRKRKRKAKRKRKREKKNKRKGRKENKEKLRNKRKEKMNSCLLHLKRRKRNVQEEEFGQ